MFYSFSPDKICFSRYNWENIEISNITRCQKWIFLYLLSMRMCRIYFFFWRKRDIITKFSLRIRHNFCTSVSFFTFFSNCHRRNRFFTDDLFVCLQFLFSLDHKKNSILFLYKRYYEVIKCLFFSCMFNKVQFIKYVG